MVEYREERPPGEELVEERSFDELAKGLATGAISRHRALKLVGAGILGTMVVGLVPGMADAKKKKKKKKKKRLPNLCPGQATCPVSTGGGCCDIATPQCCPDGRTCTTSDATCCPVSSGGGVCAGTIPVCCPPQLGGGCCPAGTICTAQGTCVTSAGLFVAVQVGRVTPLA